MSCIITYKGQKYSEEQFKEYFINNKNEFVTSISKNKDVIDSFKTKMEAIDGVFKDSPKLASIGTKTQYMQYLSTIFPDSKVKDIVYHATTADFDRFDKSKFFTSYAFHFASNKETLNKNLKLKYVLLNIKNPIDEVPSRYERDTVEDRKSKGFDGVITDADYREYERKPELGKEYVVFEPEQIHVLSSKADIEGFKEFVSKKINNIKTDESINERLMKYEESIKIPNNVKSKVLEKIEKETEKVKEKLLSLGLKQDNNKFELITNSYATFKMKLKELENVNAIISTNKTSDFYQIIARLKNVDSTMELKKQGELPFTPIEVKQVIQEQQFLNDVADNVFEGLSEEEKQILKKKIENGDYDLNCRI